MSEDAETTVLKVPVECYSRVVGYLRPVSAWNIGKRQEFADRVTFDVEGESEPAPKRKPYGDA